MAKIQSLRIRAVRGIREEISLELGGKSLLVRGDNGTGKSSMVQALEWALRGEKAPTGSMARPSEEAFRAHVRAAPGDPRTEVRLTDGSRIEVGPGGAVVDATAAPYRESCRRADPFLRRSQLLQFLGQRPVDRFRYLESFLDLAEADRIRTQLADKAKDLQASADTRKRDRKRALEAINNALPVERRPLAATWDGLERVLWTWATELDLVDGEVRAWPLIESAAEKAKQIGDDDSAAKERVRREIVGSMASTTRTAVAALPDLESAAHDLKEEVASSTDAGMVRLLESALPHLQQVEADRCPLCEQRIDRALVVESIQARLSSLSTVRTLTTAKNRSGRAWYRTCDQFQSAVSRARNDLGITPAAKQPAGVELLVASQDAENFSEVVLVIGCDAVRAWMSTSLESIAQQVAELNEVTPAGPDKVGLLSFVRAVEEAKCQRASTELAAAPERSIEQQAVALSAIAEAIRKARQDVAQHLLDQIARTVTCYYRLIHPSESASEVTGAPTIDVHRTGGGIAYLRGSFDNTAVEDPRWVYSDGHLDTVGLCVFLALRRFRADQSGDAKLMVLDDVVLSIDLGHARRLLTVLKEHFGDHQVLLFTHNGLFASWVTWSFPDFIRKSIAVWTLEGGPQLRELGSAAERLQEAIAVQSTPKPIAQAMMTLMDEFLLEARFAFHLAVPAQRGEQYTLSELWEPFCRRVRDLGKALKRPLGNTTELLQQLSDLPKVRNVLAAHDNEFAREFPLSTINEMSRSCLDLVSHVYCRECSCFAEALPDRTRPAIVCCRCRRLSYVAEAVKIATEEAAP